MIGPSTEQAHRKIAQEPLTTREKGEAGASIQFNSLACFASFSGDFGVLDFAVPLLLHPLRCTSLLIWVCVCVCVAMNTTCGRLFNS